MAFRYRFDLADRKLKVDKKSGLVISSYDEKNNILTEYSYIYDSGDPYVTACSYKGKKRTKPIECIDVTRESDTLWWTVNKDNQMYNMNMLDENKCSVIASLNGAIYTWDIDNNSKLESFFYYASRNHIQYNKIPYKSLLVNKKLTFMVEKKKFSQQDYTCTVFIEPDGKFKNSFTWSFAYNKNGLVLKEKPSDKSLSALAAQYGTDAQSISRAVKERCSIKVNDDFNNKVKMCRFFRAAENNIGKGLNYIW